MRCGVILIVRVFLFFLNHQHQHRQHRITLTFTSLPSPRSGRRRGGRSSRRSRAAALDQSTCNEWGDRRPANQFPRQEERAPRDVTTPPGQARSLPPVLASERDEERFAHQNQPVREGGLEGGIIIGAVCAFGVCGVLVLARSARRGSGSGKK